MAASNQITHGSYSVTATLAMNRGAYWAIKYGSALKNFTHPLAPKKAEIIRWLAGQSVRRDVCEKLADKIVAVSKQIASM